MADIETRRDEPYTVDLTSCDREPIQYIGAIQPIGFLLALDGDWQISQVSANVADHLGLSVEDLLGDPFRSAFRDEAIHEVRNRLSVLNGPNAVERTFAVQLQNNGALYDLAIHRSGEFSVIEGEPHIGAGTLNAGAMVRSMLERMQGPSSLVTEAVRLVHALTGFDRVMIYRFAADGSGEVIAERVRPDLEPYLGLHYPAADIPQQARALLVRNPVRLLVDVEGEPIPLATLPARANTPLDLSMSTLRAHSVMHIEYLRNMGVGATMTVSLLRDGQLWGMISCHHMTPRHVCFEQRTTVELFGQMLSLLIEKRERAEIEAYKAHTHRLRQDLVAAVIERGSAAESIAVLANRMSELVPCDGIAVCIDGVVKLDGDTPTAAECDALQGFLAINAAGQIYTTAQLGQVYEPGRSFVDRAAGMLVLPISRAPRDYIVFFRRELPHFVSWAGKPDKLVVNGPEGPRLSPRRSFEAWREIVRGQSAAWTPAELAAAEVMRVTLLEMVLQQAGMTEVENWAASQKQELLIAELNHRVRNILTLIRGLVTQSRINARDLDTFATVLGDRVHALARAHDQITAKNWGPGSLATLISTEAAAFLGAGAARVVFDGPPVMLQPQAFSTVALVIHELMTNAAKHGALAGQTGEVIVRWQVDDSARLVIDWQESGGQPVAAPTRRGFGSVIIQRSIPHELGGEATLDYAASGLHGRFVVPAAQVVQGDNPTAPLTISDPASKLAARLSGTVLLVEDNVIIALDAEELLIAMGASTVLVSSNVTEALDFLRTESPSFALLDINLGAEMSWPVADRLRQLGIPYVFATGYGTSIDYPLQHSSIPAITKPYTLDSIARVLTKPRV
ncbi:signal transduction histidine kinase [Polymorphobacter glacialis]|uniref:histidine kinase n=2 Tax=Sandarakinorhabdus glacialis TaxID=1614636 RepID=A0A917A3Z9_9SPHN|nr:signal transduction histidine kinase [Polymorphobacter glacialis]